MKWDKQGLVFIDCSWCFVADHASIIARFITDCHGPQGSPALAINAYATAIGLVDCSYHGIFNRRI